MKDEPQHSEPRLTIAEQLRRMEKHDQLPATEKVETADAANCSLLALAAIVKGHPDTPESLKAIASKELLDHNRGAYLVNELRTLRQQLLQAQAAIAEHNKKFEDHSLNAIIKNQYKPITIDLSVLDKHDAEVRKPLVDALQFYAKMLGRNCEGKLYVSHPIADDCGDRARDALAKVKEPFK